MAVNMSSLENMCVLSVRQQFTLILLYLGIRFILVRCVRSENKLCMCGH